MPEIHAERLTADVDEEFVIFLIGMRVNRPWKIHKWLPVALAMRRMIVELESHPDAGMLSVESWLGNPTMMVQYWRSFDHLEKYATRQDQEHLPAWKAFNQAVAEFIAMVEQDRWALRDPRSISDSAVVAGPDNS